MKMGSGGVKVDVAGTDVLTGGGNLGTVDEFDFHSCGVCIVPRQ